MILNINYKLLYYVLLVLLIIFILYILQLFIMIIIIDRKFFNKRFTGVENIKCYKKENFHNLKYENFSFYSNNNKLNGNIFYINKQFSNIVIFACGYKMTYQRYMPEINYLCSLGYTVFTYDNTGTGVSEGQVLKGAPQAIIDLENCVNIVKKEYPQAKITLVGHSMGGYAVINSLNLVSVDKVLAIAPFNSIVDVVLDNVNKTFHNKLFLFRTVYLMYLKTKFKKYGSYETYKTIKYVNIPVMIIHGTSDKTVLINNFYNSMMTNQNLFVKYLMLENKNHNPLLSFNAMTYNLFLDHSIMELKMKYRKKIIPEKELNDINDNINEELRSEFDKEVINEITNFLK